MRSVICLLIAAVVTVQVVGADQPLRAAAPSRAMWYWNPSPVLGDRDARAAFIEFCRQQHVGIVWAQVAVADEDGRVTLRRADDWRELLREAHRAGLRIHALDGRPQYARRDHHAEALAVVDAVTAFNAAAPPDARFDGIHFDNEPYRLLAWRDPRQRERVLLEFLELQALVQARVRAAGGLEYGIDIPFWWQARDARSREAIGVVTFRGVRQAASYHCLDLVDNVGIMDYRRRAEGDDGLIAHAAELLSYADRVGRVRVRVGVETSGGESAPYWFLAGVSRKALADVSARGSAALEALGDLAPEVIEQGDVVLVGVRASEPTDRRAAQVLLAFARLFDLEGTAPGGRPSRSAPIRSGDGDADWLDVREADLTDSDSGRVFAGVRATRVMLPKLTFAGVTNAEMERELGIAERSFLGHASYAGLAIHDHESYQARFPR